MSIRGRHNVVLCCKLMMLGLAALVGLVAADGSSSADVGGACGPAPGTTGGCLDARKMRLKQISPIAGVLPPTLPLTLAPS